MTSPDNPEPLPTSAAVALKVNGETLFLTQPHNLPHLFAELKFPPNALLVELNGVALLRHEWEGAVLSEGDRVELLRIVAGG